MWLHLYVFVYVSDKMFKTMQYYSAILFIKYIKIIYYDSYLSIPIKNEGQIILNQFTDHIAPYSQIR